VSGDRALGASALLAAVFMWGTSFPVLKVGLESLPPITYAAMRFTLASGVVLLTFHLFHRTGSIAALRENWPILTAVGVFGITLPNMAINVGMQYTTASVTSMIISSGPVFTLLLAVGLLHERLTATIMLGTLVALVGTFLLVEQDGLDLGSSTLAGNLLVLIGAVCYSVSGTASKVGLRSVGPYILTGWSIVIGTIPLVILSPVEWGEGISLGPSIAANVAYLALFPAILATVLSNYALERRSLSSYSFFMYLIPVFSTAIAIMFLEEMVTLETAIFAALIITGVAIAHRGRERR
jgi:drug/metabolite transporter (DMT)-like permease